MDKAKAYYLKQMEEHRDKINQYLIEKEYENYINEQIENTFKQGINLGIEQGKNEGIKQGISRGIQMQQEQNDKKTLNAIINLSKNLNIDYIQAMNLLELLKEDQDKYIELLKI